MTVLNPEINISKKKIINVIVIFLTWIHLTSDYFNVGSCSIMQAKNWKDISPNVIPFIILSAVCSYLLPNTEWQLIISQLYPDLYILFHSVYLDSSTSPYRDWLGPEVANNLPIFTMRSWDDCFQPTTYTQRPQIIISCHFCTERLGKNLQQYNKATLLEFIQWDKTTKMVSLLTQKMRFVCCKSLSCESASLKSRLFSVD